MCVLIGHALRFINVFVSATSYPSAIARACAAIDETPAFRDLPDGYIRVVVRIVKKIRLCCLNSPIFASRGALAQESGKSLETVGRVVKWLEDRGLIHRAQKARAGLRGSTSPITPTTALLQALTLLGEASPATSMTDLHSPLGGEPRTADVPSAPDSDAPDRSILTAPSAASTPTDPHHLAPMAAAASALASEAQPSVVPSTAPVVTPPASASADATAVASDCMGVFPSVPPVPCALKPLIAPIPAVVAFGPLTTGNPVRGTASAVRIDASKSTLPQQSKENQPAWPAPFVKIDGCTVPSELAWLITRNALKATGVLALMKLAGSRKQRLSDIVAASRKYLEGLTDRSLFAYLRKLVMQDRDYRALVEEDVKAHQASQDKARLGRKAVELEGRAFKTRDGRIELFVKANGLLHQVAPDRAGYRPMDQAFLDAIEDGRLVPFVA
jgi:hypothetical protein